MIRLTRIRTEAAVPADFRGDARVQLARELIDRFKNEEEPRPAVWKKAKLRLRTDSFNKCAYCESSTAVVAHGDVEHFRPKSEYWWLAYSIDNFTFACQICNQSYKGSNFPRQFDLVQPDLPTNGDDAALAAAAAKLYPDPLDGGAVESHSRQLSKERAHLPDPYTVNPEPLFAWFADDVLKEVEVRRRGRKVAAVRAHAAAVEFLGLNRDELKRRRYETYRAARTLADLLRNPDLPDDAATIATEQLKTMMDAASEYAGMVRYFVNERWQLGL